MGEGEFGLLRWRRPSIPLDSAANAETAGQIASAASRKYSDIICYIISTPTLTRTSCTPPPPTSAVLSPLLRRQHRTVTRWTALTCTKV